MSENTTKGDKNAHSFLSLKCSDIGHPECSHVAYGVSEEPLFRNHRYHVINTHGYTEESWEKELLEKIEEFRKLMRMSSGKV